MTWLELPASFDPVIDDALYIGNLASALSQDLRKKLGITHVLSVCTEHTFEPQPNWLTIAVYDSEYEDLLIHLPKACAFIQGALDCGGRVLVHCVMGVSRSATVACAYLMMSQRLSASAAIQYLRKRRPQVHPNYGFRKQLQAFADCRYTPSCTNAEYIAWKRRQKREATKYLNLITDTVPVVPDQLYINSEFPSDSDAAESLLLDMDVTHLLSISSAQLPRPNLPPNVEHCFIDIPNDAREALLLELPTACRFVSEAILKGRRVLIQCRVELRACIVTCAYLMATRKISPRQAHGVLESALPLYNATSTFYRHLDLFEACEYNPTIDHPLVRAWLAEQGIPSASSGGSRSCTSSTLSSTSIPTSSAVAGTKSLVQTNYSSSSVTWCATALSSGSLPQNPNLKSGGGGKSGLHSHMNGASGSQCLVSSKASHTASACTVCSTSSSIPTPLITAVAPSPSKPASSPPHSRPLTGPSGVTRLECHRQCSPISV